MRWVSLLLCGWWLGCAASEPRPPVSPVSAWEDSAEDAHGCHGGGGDRVLSWVCSETGCALYRGEEQSVGRITRTFAGTPPPVFIAPGSSAQRTWGSAQRLPGAALPVMVFRWHPREKLPSEVQRQQAFDEWERRPKERHHIFPQALQGYFARKGINVHDYVIAIDAEVHARIHRGKNGGPWNAEWRAFIEHTLGEAEKHEHFEHAGALIQRFALAGYTMTYWQRFDLTPVPRD
ncbi:TIGR02269 family lipoprotein [Corallococcus sp. BB11-1]|uniref:SitA6 family polymorphic toxin lipoprotein n=1 Tax=Corallococcus sp. BB11-1 TaxID=2996783 RepID=UPI00226F45A7|nr:TIGR02269 family lipoprotein [Corallococcus sp. BB11-1]MCY1033582.1 TIGR02269 family lipoprotein [Corallococcus sp. BB11-1]